MKGPPCPERQDGESESAYFERFVAWSEASKTTTTFDADLIPDAAPSVRPRPRPADGRRPIERVLEAMTVHDRRFTNRGDQYVGQCPAHFPDNTPSFSFRDAGERVLVKCFRECSFEEIVGGLGLEPSDLFLESTLPLALVPVSVAPVSANGDHAPDVNRLQPLGDAIFDTPPISTPLWGTSENVIWAQQEPLQIVAVQGVGKTTVGQQLMRASMGLRDQVLGFPVHRFDRGLYLALDRPAQAMRSMRRMVSDGERDVMNRWVAWKGPLARDVAKNNDLLAELALEAGAGVMFIDSMKDLAIGLRDDDVGAGLNIAFQKVIHAGVELVVLHHPVKHGAITLADIYGSVWLTAGFGSIVVLEQRSSEGFIRWHHLKSPLGEVHIDEIDLDLLTGEMTARHSFDLNTWLQSVGRAVTTGEAVKAMTGEEEPSATARRSMRSRLDRLANRGLVGKTSGAATGLKTENTYEWVGP